MSGLLRFLDRETSRDATTAATLRPGRTDGTAVDHGSARIKVDHHAAAAHPVTALRQRDSTDHCDQPSRQIIDGRAPLGRLVTLVYRNTAGCIEPVNLDARRSAIGIGHGQPC